MRATVGINPRNADKVASSEHDALRQ
jgi:hypothetical protein